MAKHFHHNAWCGVLFFFSVGHFVNSTKLVVFRLFEKQTAEKILDANHPLAYAPGIMWGQSPVIPPYDIHATRYYYCFFLPIFFDHYSDDECIFSRNTSEIYC